MSSPVNTCINGEKHGKCTFNSKITYFFNENFRRNGYTGFKEGFSMSKKRLDSLKQAISELTETLGITETYLAGFLGVTEKSLNEWKKLGMGDLTPKAKRLLRLYEVVEYLKSAHPEVPTSAYKSLIENGRIVIDPKDSEDGSLSLLNFIIEEPESKIWLPCVKDVVHEFIRNNLKETERPRENYRPVRHA
jgi:hypothetical protein